MPRFVLFGGGHGDGALHVLHVLVRLPDWQREISDTGCLFRNALAACPESAAIRHADEEHKANVRQMFRIRLSKAESGRGVDALTDALLVLHEGLTKSARLMGEPAAATAARFCARASLASEDIH